MKSETEKEAFVKTVGKRIAHVTAIQNCELIVTIGLKSAHSLASLNRFGSVDLRLRSERLELDCKGHKVRLNHQKPLLAGRNKTEKFLDGHTIESWAEQLDKRIFFWPENKGAEFEKGLHKDLLARTLWLDTALFFDLFYDDIQLCPINSGNATRNPAYRGDWIYVSLSNGLPTFRENRAKRGLVKTADKVVDISLCCDIPPNLLADLQVGNQNTSGFIK